MAKLDDLKRTGMANAMESMGAFATPSAPPPAPVQDPRHDGVTRVKNVCVIPIDKVARDPGQPREEFDPEALQRLADSLKERGQLQPVGVRWDGASGVYVLVFGERRWRAAGLAGLPAVNAVVMDGPLSADDLVVIQLVENAVREDLRPVEQARAYRRLMDVKGWSARQAARELCVDHSRVVRALALLDLPRHVQEQVDGGSIAATTAYEITKAEPARHEDLARLVVDGGLRTADVAKSRAPGRGRTRKFRTEIHVPGGSVSVTLDDPEPSDEAVVAALQAALKRFKKERPARTEAA